MSANSTAAKAALAQDDSQLVVKTTNFKSSNFLAKTKVFTGEKATPNKNGDDPILLVIISGKCPKNRVLDGTVAENMGLLPDTLYLMSATLGSIDPKYGPQVNYEAIIEVSDPMTILTMTEKLGEPILLDL